MHEMETSDDAIYGDGFRDALAAYVACGYSLSRLMERVKESGGQLPRRRPMLAAWAKQPGRSFQGAAGAFQHADDGRRTDTRRRAKVFDEARRRLAEERRTRGASGARPGLPQPAAPALSLVGSLSRDLDEAACGECEA